MGNTIFVVGLLKPLNKRFESHCARNGLYSRAVLADIGREGTFTLLPVGQDAKHALHAYVDKLNDYQDGLVVVLPYADLSDDLRHELETLAECGCTVIWAANEEDAWPKIKRRQKPDTSILNAVYERLLHCLPGIQQNAITSVSDHFQAVLEKNDHIHFHDSILDCCNAVAPHRYEFMKSAINALSDFIALGSDGRIDAFFRERGIEHAQSGGINTTLKVLLNGHEIYKKTANTHLKKGDKTTPEGAARIYYQIFHFDDASHLAILYAGPHPESDVSWTLEIG
ncbi:hypothetical protein [Pseudomonas aeruginosa]|uniref:hypothetical protein n=1 Tax=Pseudomonas aeruginosa TaxID=287 RepID=UPI0013C51A63|nr:hypothetical protein [Pseudomonas aeruginosa]